MILTDGLDWQFNDTDELTEGSMVARTNIPVKDLRHHVMSLVKVRGASTRSYCDGTLTKWC
jgi:hypothetical protein